MNVKCRLPTVLVIRRRVQTGNFCYGTLYQIRMPSCGQRLSAIRVQIGTTAPCPNCNAAVTVPITSTFRSTPWVLEVFDPRSHPVAIELPAFKPLFVPTLQCAYLGVS